MDKETKLTLEDFRNRALQRERDKKLFVFLEVEGFGEVKFSRPKENEILTYMDECAKAVKTDEEGNAISQDLRMIFEASKSLVYFSCDFLQDKELRESLGIKDPLDAPFKVFGINETISLAGEIMAEFEGGNIVEEIDDLVKN